VTYFLQIEQALDEWRWGFRIRRNKVKVSDLAALKGRYDIHLNVLEKFDPYTRQAIRQTLFQDIAVE
jgi:hypothetical protein